MLARCKHFSLPSHSWALVALCGFTFVDGAKVAPDDEDSCDESGLNTGEISKDCSSGGLLE